MFLRKSMCLFLLLLTCAAVFFTIPVQDADARNAKAAKELIIAGAGFFFGVSFQNKVSKTVQAIEDATVGALEDAMHNAWDAIVDHYDNSYYCPGCGTTVSGSHNCRDNYYYDGSYGY